MEAAFIQDVFRKCKLKHQTKKTTCEEQKINAAAAAARSLLRSHDTGSGE